LLAAVVLSLLATFAPLATCTAVRRAIRHRAWSAGCVRHARELREAGRIRRAIERRVIERCLKCGDPHHGFARIYCELAGYMLRAPMSPEKMSYDATSGTVIYRSKMHLGLKRNFQVMPGADTGWSCCCATCRTATST